MRIEINGTMHMDLLEAAQLLNVHPESLSRLHRYKQIPAMRLRGLYFPVTMIEDRLHHGASGDTFVSKT